MLGSALRLLSLLALRQFASHSLSLLGAEARLLPHGLPIGQELNSRSYVPRDPDLYKPAPYSSREDLRSRAIYGRDWIDGYHASHFDIFGRDASYRGDEDLDFLYSRSLRPDRSLVPRAPTKTMTAAQVKSLKAAAKELVDLIKGKAPNSLVLFVGNSPSYLFHAISPADRATCNMHLIPLSSWPPPAKLPQKLVEGFAKNVMKPAVQAKPFVQTVIVDVVMTGTSAAALPPFLKELEPLCGTGAGGLKTVKLIRLVDEADKKPPYKDVSGVYGPDLGVIIPAGQNFMRLMSDEHGFPRLTPTYRFTSFLNPPPEVSDPKGRLDILAQIEGGSPPSSPVAGSPPGSPKGGAKDSPPGSPKGSPPGSKPGSPKGKTA